MTHGYSLAELDHEEALVEVGAAVGAADEVLLLVALVLAQRPLRLRAELEVLRLDICGGEEEKRQYDSRTRQLQRASATVTSLWYQGKSLKEKNRSSSRSILGSHTSVAGPLAHVAVVLVDDAVRAAHRGGLLRAVRRTRQRAPIPLSHRQFGS